MAFCFVVEHYGATKPTITTLKLKIEDFDKSSAYTPNN
jgi:hypothetical protein